MNIKKFKKVENSTKTSNHALLEQIGLEQHSTEQELTLHATYLEKRVEQFLRLNEKQEEQIYRQNLQITDLCNTIRQLQANIKQMQGDVHPVVTSAGESHHPELATPQARLMLDKLVGEGLLDGAYRPVGLSIAERGVLASLLATRLGVANLWQVLGSLWGMKAETLRSGNSKAQDQTKTARFIDRIQSVIR